MATTLATVVRMVSHGVGVTMVPEGALSLMGEQEGYAVARFGLEAPSRRIGLVHRASSSRKADFAELAQVLTGLVRASGLPLRELGDTTCVTVG